MTGYKGTLRRFARPLPGALWEAAKRKFSAARASAEHLPDGATAQNQLWNAFTLWLHLLGLDARSVFAISEVQKPRAGRGLPVPHRRRESPLARCIH